MKANWTMRNLPATPPLNLKGVTVMPPHDRNQSRLSIVRTPTSTDLIWAAPPGVVPREPLTLVNDPPEPSPLSPAESPTIEARISAGVVALLRFGVEFCGASSGAPEPTQVISVDLGDTTRIDFEGSVSGSFNLDRVIGSKEARKGTREAEDTRGQAGGSINRPSTAAGQRYESLSEKIKELIDAIAEDLSERKQATEEEEAAARTKIRIVIEPPKR